METHQPKADPGNFSGFSFSIFIIVFWSRFCLLLTAETPTVLKIWELFLLKNEPEEITALRIIFTVGVSQFQIWMKQNIAWRLSRIILNFKMWHNLIYFTFLKYTKREKKFFRQNE